MKSPYICELQENSTPSISVLVQSKEIRQKKTGEPYLSLILSDKTGEIDGKMWDNVTEILETFERDDFVRVKGLVQIYHNRVQLVIHKLRPMEDREVDFTDFFPCSKYDPAVMWDELRGHVNSVGNAHVQALLNAILDDPEIARRYRMAPAAKQIHHAFLSGLLEHVLSLCRLSRLIAPHYPFIDCDLLIAGAVLHDLGKIYELSYDRGFAYTAEGQLLGHMMIGLRIVADKLRVLPDFPTPLRTLIEHIILSHHGQLDYGSPKVPQFAEALLFHYLDDLDSKMECTRSLLERDQTPGSFTAFSHALERGMLKKAVWLDPASAPKRATAPVPKAAPAAAPQPSASVTPVSLPPSPAPGTPVPAGPVPPPSISPAQSAPMSAVAKPPMPSPPMPGTPVPARPVPPPSSIPAQSAPVIPVAKPAMPSPPMTGTPVPAGPVPPPSITPAQSAPMSAVAKPAMPSPPVTGTPLPAGPVPPPSSIPAQSAPISAVARPPMPSPPMPGTPVPAGPVPPPSVIPAPSAPMSAVARPPMPSPPMPGTPVPAGPVPPPSVIPAPSAPMSAAAKPPMPSPPMPGTPVPAGPVPPPSITPAQSAPMSAAARPPMPSPPMPGTPIPGRPSPPASLSHTPGAPMSGTPRSPSVYPAGTSPVSHQPAAQTTSALSKPPSAPSPKPDSPFASKLLEALGREK